MGRELSPLPSPVGAFTTSDLLPVSALTRARECKLKAIVPYSVASQAPLPRSPTAALGDVLHALSEWASLSPVPEMGSYRRLAIAKLSELLDEAHSEASGDSLVGWWPRLDETQPPSVWRAKQRRFIRLAATLLGRPRHSAPSKERKRKPSLDDVHGPGVWVELGIRAPVLGVRGRMDRFEWEPSGLAHVLDYKTGSTHDEEGEIHEGIRVQLRLYGLAVRELRPEVDLRLEVHDGASLHEVELDGGDLDELRGELKALQEECPPESDVDEPLRLASPSPNACYWCGLRHRCPPYLEAAPRWRRYGSPEGPIPPDYWGTVAELRERQGRLSILLRDESGFPVWVRGLDPARGLRERVLVGDRLWFFGLVADRRPSSDDRFEMDRSPHDLPQGPDPRRAWTLAIFHQPADR